MCNDSDACTTPDSCQDGHLHGDAQGVHHAAALSHRRHVQPYDGSLRVHPLLHRFLQRRQRMHDGRHLLCWCLHRNAHGVQHAAALSHRRYMQRGNLPVHPLLHRFLQRRQRMHDGRHLLCWRLRGNAYGVQHPAALSHRRYMQRGNLHVYPLLHRFLQRRQRMHDGRHLLCWCLRGNAHGVQHPAALSHRRYMQRGNLHVHPLLHRFLQRRQRMHDGRHLLCWCLRGNAHGVQHPAALSHRRYMQRGNLHVHPLLHRFLQRRQPVYDGRHVLCWRLCGNAHGVQHAACLSHRRYVQRGNLRVHPFLHWFLHRQRQQRVHHRKLHERNL